MPRRNIMMAAMIPRTGSGKCIRAKVGHGLVFCTWGEPGRGCHSKVNAPKGNGTWNQPLGMSAALKREMAIGRTTKVTTKRETPPYVRTAQHRTTANIALSLPSLLAIRWEMASAYPLTSLISQRQPQINTRGNSSLRSLQNRSYKLPYNLP